VCAGDTDIRRRAATRAEQKRRDLITEIATGTVEMPRVRPLAEKAEKKKVERNITCQGAKVEMGKGKPKGAQMEMPKVQPLAKEEEKRRVETLEEQVGEEMRGQQAAASDTPAKGEGEGRTTVTEAPFASTDIRCRNLLFSESLVTDNTAGKVTVQWCRMKLDCNRGRHCPFRHFETIQTDFSLLPMKPIQGKQGLNLKAKPYVPQSSL
jgi:hypothetical protein